MPNEPALVALADRLERAQIPFVRICEIDAPFCGALMAIGVVPARKETLRRHFSSLPLLK